MNSKLDARNPKLKIYIWPLLIFLLSGCATLQEVIKTPEASLTTTKITGIDLESVSMAFDVKITNPNPIGISLSGFDYLLTAKDKKIVEGSKQDRLEIKKAGEGNFSIPVLIRYADIYKVIQGLKDANKVPFKFEGNLYIENPLARGNPFKIPFSKSGELPVFKIPSLSLSHLKVEKLSLMGADILLGLKIKNPNSFDFSFDDFAYHLNLGSFDIVEGSLAGKKTVKEGKEGLWELPVHIDLLGLGLAGQSVLTGEKVDYEFKIKTRIATPWAGIDLPFDLKGEIDVR
ncbi:MAG: LEA type 2 family protein [bacterium]|nr:LEA type 2 family protein [bacterium]